MKLKKSIIGGAAAIALISGLALAHPHSETDSNDVETDKDVKVYKFGKNGKIKIGELDIEGFDIEDFDLETMLEDLDGLDGLEGLKALKGLKSLKNLEALKELHVLKDFDIQTFDSDDGSTKIIIKSGKDGVLDLGELHADRDEKHGKHVMRIEKHKKHLKDILKEDRDNSRTIIKKLLKKDGDQDIAVWADKDWNNFPRTLDLDDGTEVIIDEDGDVTVLRDGETVEPDDADVNIQKNVTVENGKRKTRIVIEMETDAE